MRGQATSYDQLFRRYHFLANSAIFSKKWPFWPFPLDLGVYIIQGVQLIMIQKYLISAPLRIALTTYLFQIMRAICWTFRFLCLHLKMEALSTTRKKILFVELYNSLNYISKISLLLVSSVNGGSYSNALHAIFPRD